MSAPLAATREASELILALIAEHKEISFHFSTRYGPMLVCLPKGDLIIRDSDVMVGQYCGVPVYMAAGDADRWTGRTCTIVLKSGRLPAFSLEAPYGQHFELRTEPLAANVSAGGS